MMHFTGFKSKKDLAERIKRTGEISMGTKPYPPLYAHNHFVETSMFGAELQDNGTFCVCMDHPKRSKFANVTVKDGIITGVK